MSDRYETEVNLKHLNDEELRKEVDFTVSKRCAGRDYHLSSIREQMNRDARRIVELEAENAEYANDFELAVEGATAGWQERAQKAEAIIGGIYQALERGYPRPTDLRDCNAVTKGEIILNILKENKHAMAPKHIKAVLKAQNATEKTWGQDYIYVHQILNRDKKRNHPMFRTTNTGRYLPA